MLHQLQQVEDRFLEIEGYLSNPALADQPQEFKKYSQEHASLQEIVATFRRYKALQTEIHSHEDLLKEKDPELVALAQEELQQAGQELQEVTKQLQWLLLPKDPLDARNSVLEMRAGAGGEEAGLFVGELFRAYQRYAEKQGWRVTLLSVQPTGVGGFKEIIAEIQGNRVYSKLKWEAGVHRVQRVPETEAQGRVHTSTITVAVLPEAEEVDVVIQPTDLKIDVFRSSGAGGQSVNTTDSAVRITHLPSGLVVVCQDERSQHKNKDRALKILRSRLLSAEQDRQKKAEGEARRTMVGTGDRSERIRTYNFPQGRLTDHRIGLTLYQLADIMEGKMEELLQALGNYYQVEALKRQGLSDA